MKELDKVKRAAAKAEKKMSNLKPITEEVAEFGSSEYNQNVFINACKYRDEMREKWPEEQDDFFEI